MEKLEIIVIDDNVMEDDPLMVELAIEYDDDNIKLFQHSNDGLNYILEHLSTNMVVVLDINFPSTEYSGSVVLEKIRKQDKLIPIILCSAKDGTQEGFIDFINNHAFFYVQKPSPTKEILLRVRQAVHHLNLDVATAIENWLEQQENKDQILMVSGSGQSYSTNDLIREIRLETKAGQKIEEDILQLTIDLLFRKKENI